ncbi:MAG: acyl carrier protein [Candidatus Omnitrophica bacterium]|nr:acyl carrier protein [Candidatus Omnitrophota bacterium]
MSNDEQYCCEEEPATKENTMEERIQKVLSSVFTSHEGRFDISDGPNGISDWDSLNHLNLVMALQDEFGVELGFEDMLEITVVGDIKNVLTRKIS